jgi:penicillin-binding protein 1C
MSSIPRIAWKTGTSFGKRDAWAIGFNPHYTIGVWLGNFNGKGSPHLSGAETALPLLIELFNTIDYGNNGWFEKPETLKQREVCSETGLIPSQFCTNITSDYYIENTSLNTICNLMREVIVNSDETIQYCFACCPDENFKKVIYPFYPPELTLWFQNMHIQYSHPPEHNPDCSAMSGMIGPKIISPTEDYEYYLEDDGMQKIALQAASEGMNKYHIWYVNNNYLGKFLSGEKAFFKPKEGFNEITCIDDFGRHSSVKIKVKMF